MDSSVNTPPVTLTVRMIMQGKEVGSIIGKKVSAAEFLRFVCFSDFRSTC